MTGIFWIAIGLGVLWLCAVAWTMLWDRPRGRRRCPRCFYDMSGLAAIERPDARSPTTPTPSRCPECGKAIRSERALRKTRCRWGRATLATIVLLLPATLTAAIGRVQQTGGWSDLPSWVTTRLLWLDEEELYEDTYRRLSSYELSLDETRLVTGYAQDLLESGEYDRIDRGLTLLYFLAEHASSVHRRVHRTPLSPPFTGLDQTATPGLADTLLTLATDSADGRVAMVVLSALQESDLDARLGLLRLAADEDPDLSGFALDMLVLSLKYPDEAEYRPRMPNLGSHRPEHACTAVYLLRYRTPAHPSVSKVILTSPPEVDRLVRSTTRNFAKSVVVEPGSDAAVREAAFALASTPPAVGSPHGDTALRRKELLDHTLGLWLFCQLDGYGTESRAVAKQAVATWLAEDPYAAEILSAFPFDSQTEEVLRRAMLSSNPNQRLFATALAMRYGELASGLAPDVINVVRRAFFRDLHTVSARCLAIGGDPADLQAMLISRVNRDWHDPDLRALLRSAADPSISREIPYGKALPWIEPELLLLAELRIPDEQAVSLLREIMESGQRYLRDLAIVAFAATGGDRATASEMANRLMYDERFAGPKTQAIQASLFIKEGLADPALMLRFIEEDLAHHNGGYSGYNVNMVSPMLLALEQAPPGVAASYRESLQRIRDADHDGSDAARKLLEQIDARPLGR